MLFGRILKRDIFEDELESKWPKPGDFLSNADWDVWLRLDDNLKGRDCIVPEISRTYHFGAKGVNMNEFFHERFFAKKPLNKVSGIKFNIERLQKLSYDKEIHELIRYTDMIIMINLSVNDIKVLKTFRFSFCSPRQCRREF